MKIIMSPSKTQDFSPVSHLDKTLITPALFPEKTKQLYELAQHWSPEDIQSIYKVSQTLSNLIHKQFHEAHLLKKPAIDAYTGVAFSAFTLEDYTRDQVHYIGKTLVILSAMYGLLTPFTLMSPYRMDFSIKPNGLQLYDFWQKEIEAYLGNEELIISLASKEFEKLLSPLKHRIVTIVFKESPSRNTPSYHTKRLRGELAHLMVLKQIASTDTLKQLTFSGYCYNPIQSSEKTVCFMKEAVY